MNAAIEWVNHASLVWWNGIVQTCWQAALVGAVLLVIVHLLGKRWPAPLRYALLVLALLKFACPPLLPVPTGLFTHLTPPRILWSGIPERKPVQASDSRAQPPKVLSPQSVISLQSLSWTGCLMILHGLGTGFVGLVIVKQTVRLRRLVRGSRVLRLDETLSGQYRDLAIQLGLFRIPPVTVSDEVDGPMAYGIRKPGILLPSNIAERLSPPELKAVLAHELAHCQRGDLCLNLVQVALVAVWWFHPVLWLVNRSVRDIREDCCDDLLLVRGVISNDAYCDVLLRAASESSAALPLAASVGLRGGLHPLGRRLARITDWGLQRSDGISGAGATVVLLSAVLLWPGVRDRNAALETKAEDVSPAPTTRVHMVQVPPMAVPEIAAVIPSVTSSNPPPVQVSAPSPAAAPSEDFVIGHVVRPPRAEEQPVDLRARSSPIAELSRTGQSPPVAPHAPVLSRGNQPQFPPRIPPSYPGQSLAPNWNPRSYAQSIYLYEVARRQQLVFIPQNRRVAAAHSRQAVESAPTTRALPSRTYPANSNSPWAVVR